MQRRRRRRRAIADDDDVRPAHDAQALPKKAARRLELERERARPLRRRLLDVSHARRDRGDAAPSRCQTRRARSSAAPRRAITRAAEVEARRANRAGARAAARHRTPNAGQGAPCATAQCTAAYINVACRWPRDSTSSSSPASSASPTWATSPTSRHVRDFFARYLRRRGIERRSHRRADLPDGVAAPPRHARARDHRRARRPAPTAWCTSSATRRAASTCAS